MLKLVNLMNRRGENLKLLPVPSAKKKKKTAARLRRDNQNYQKSK